MRQRCAGLRGDDRGAVLLFFALLLVSLLGMAAFMVDLGWLYWQGIETQHGADAAALGGVIFEPDDQASAYSTAFEVAAQNGYVDAVNSTVTPIDFRDDPGFAFVDNTHQLYVRVDRAVPTFFMKVFGINSVTLSRHAVAEYVLPLPLGSPNNRFGNDPAAGEWPNFWGNIHGYYTGRGMGDRFSSQCVSWQSGSGCTKNPDRRQTQYIVGNEELTAGGYTYGIEVDDSAGLSVSVFDGAFTRGGGDQWLVGDNPQGSSPGPTTVFMVFSPDPTPLDLSDGNTHLCTLTFAPQDPWADFNGDGSINNGDDQDGDGDLDWDDLPPALINAQWDSFGCSLDQGPGIYPLRVLTLDNGERGLNRWSMKATAASDTPRLYGLGDMAIYSNVDGTAGNTVFYLAEVEEVHAGKTLEIDLWDPGDASGNHSIRVIDSQGNQPACSWTSTNSSYPGGTLGSCDIPTSGSRFNNHNIKISIDLPATYACGADCWWKIDYNYPATTQDTTTWSARIVGNPVRLVE